MHENGVLQVMTAKNIFSAHELLASADDTQKNKKLASHLENR